MKGRMFVVFLLLVSSAAAQLDTGNRIRRVRVRVAFGTGVCDPSADVTLTGPGGTVVDGTANDQCEVDFFNLPEGTYRLNVSGKNFANADSGSIHMTADGPAEFVVQVKRSHDLDRSFGVPTNAFVAASDLGVPSRARKEFDRANELLGKQDFAQAIQKLNKAISIYPAYAVAYNNLGVIYARFEDRVREREALQQAIRINDHFALAYLNLGKMNIASGDFPEAETALNKAATFDPADPVTLVLLSYAEFMDRRFDQAVATSRAAHRMDKSHAFVHRVAARAFEQKREGTNAIEELELFLQEAPNGPGADAARKELETVKAVLPGFSREP